MKKFVIISILFLLATTAFAGRLVVRHRYITYRPVVTRTVVVKPITGSIDINCNCKEARVYVNGNLVGKAGSFDGFPGKLELRPGTYRIKIVYHGQVYKERIRVLAGKELNLNTCF